MLSKGTLKVKMGAAAAIAATALCGLTFVDIYSVKQGTQALASVYEDQVKPVAALQEMESDLKEVRFRMAGVLLDQMPAVGSSNQLRDTVRDLPESWNAFRSKAASHPASTQAAELAAKIEESIPQFLTLSEKLEKAYANSDKKTLSSLLEDDWPVIQAQLVKPLEQLISEQQKAVKETYEASRRSGTRLMSLGLTISIVSVLVSLIFGLLISRSILIPLRQTMNMLEAVAAGDLTQHLEVKTKDEIGAIAAASNKMNASLEHMIHSIAASAEDVARASQQLSAASQTIAANSEETCAQADVVSQSARSVSQNLQSVSTGAGEMTSTIQSIASNAREAASVAGDAVQAAQAANGTVAKLGDSSLEIGEVIKVITGIAQQTNLLALNATIEAARAGEAGKGFAVVANEVKELAKQTAKATEDISRMVEAIQAGSKDAVEAIGSIGAVITRMNEISGTIATAVEQQSATTSEMTRNLTGACAGSGEITHNIDAVAQAARGTSSHAHQSDQAADSLAKMAAQLRALVQRFKIDLDPAQVESDPRAPHKKASAAAG